MAFDRDLTLWNLAKDYANGSIKHLRIIIVLAWGSAIILLNGQRVVFALDATVGLQPSSMNSVSL